ncbi:symporter [Spirochaetia bacterium]|nr:symporter [Spirochaetia bacterium]
MNIQLVILAVYVIALLILAAWSTQIQRKSNKSRMLEYLLAGRNMPWVIVAVMLVGLAVGGASTVGVAQNAYTKGLSAGWYNAAWGAGGIFVGLFTASYLRKMKVKTIPEMMGLMYGPKTRLLGVINQLLILITITSMQYVAGGAILTALMPKIFPTLQAGMIASAVIFIAITVVGGYWASGLTNFVNVIVIYVGIVAALIQSFKKFGALDVIKQSLPPGDQWFAWIGHAPAAMGGWAVAGFMAVMITQAISNQAVSQISFAARDEKTAKTGFIVGGILILPAGFLCALFGIIAAAHPELFPADATVAQRAAMALPTIAAQLTPLVGGVFLAALWAADISTAISLLMGCSTLVVEDIVKKIRKKPIEGKNQLLTSRITVLIVSLFAFFLALTSSSIVATITTALAICSSFTIIILANIYLPNTCKKVAGFPLMLASLLLWLCWTFLPLVEKVSPAVKALNIKAFFKGQLVYPEWIVCLLIFVLCAIFGKTKVEKLVPQDEV